MNRQCYVNEVNGWVDYGEVSIAEAAILEAKNWSADIVTVQVRDEDEPEAVYTLTIRRRVVYSVESTRGQVLAREKLTRRRKPVAK